MKRFPIAAAVAVSAPLLAGPAARAQFQTGAQLYDQCQHDTGPALAACLSYLAGTFDHKEVLDIAAGPGARNFCPPATLTLGQARSSVLKHIRDDPERLQLDGARIVLGAMTEAYPCTRRGQTGPAGADRSPTPALPSPPG